jgi:hypothetical protein
MMRPESLGYWYLDHSVQLRIRCARCQESYLTENHEPQACTSLRRRIAAAAENHEPQTCASPRRRIAAAAARSFGAVASRGKVAMG